MGDYAKISSTSFLVLYAEYLESKNPNGILHDSKTIELVESLDYDFSQFLLSADDILDVATRKTIVKNLILRFVEENSTGTIINLGCGLSTYSECVKDLPIIWYDLDLPEVIELKKKYFPESTKYQLISKSVLDFSWIKNIPQDRKVLVVMEGLLPYFQDKEVELILKEITNAFEGCDMLIQAVSPWCQKHKHPELEKNSLNLNWDIESGSDITEWFPDLIVRDELFIFAHNRKRMSLKRQFFTLFPFFKKQNMIIYLSPKTEKTPQ